MAADAASDHSLATRWAKAKALKAQDDALAASASKSPDASTSRSKLDEQGEIRFKASHGIVVAFLTWLILVHVIGIFFFTKGFLLTRLVLDDKSECAVSPASGAGHLLGDSSTKGCWHPKTFDKAVVVIVDALRYDFTVPFLASPEQREPQLFHNSLRLLHETAVDQPGNAFLLPFIADPPTATLQRLKGLTTGTLPTFIDLGSNFAGTAIEEDNLVAQLRNAGKRLVHLGDDTWHSLFPGYFDPDLTRAYDSFNVWDLHTVDDGVTEHLLPLLHPTNTSKWDIIIGHYLGVDHAGHRYGPNHPAMKSKLQQMDEVFREVIERLDDSTLLVVMGDHGMDTKGDHGGESYDEVQAALWMYSKKGIFGRTSAESVRPPQTARERPVGQIDLVPTLSLLLGIPIPFNNLGSPIEEAFIGKSGTNWQNLAAVNHLAAAQIKRYQQEYAVARGLDSGSTSKPLELWNKAQAAWDTANRRPSDQVWQEAKNRLTDYQIETLRICKSLWARFDVASMAQGITILAGAMIVLVFCARGIRGDVTLLTPSLLRRATTGSGVGAIAGALMAFVPPLSLSPTEGTLLGFALGGILGVVFLTALRRQRLTSIFPDTIWGWIALVFTIAPSIGFASNSYTIWEDEILLFLIGSFGLVAALSSLRQKSLVDRTLGIYQSILFVVLTRLASLSRLCREEQMPYCVSTYYASAASSTSAPWQLIIPFVLALFLPDVVKSYYKSTRSYEGPAIFWVGFAFRMGLLLTALFWTLDAADDGDWLDISKEKLKTIRIVISQLVLAVALAAGSTYYFWAKPCLNVQQTLPPSTDPPSQESPPANNRPPTTRIVILGYANAHGTRFLFLVINLVLTTLLLSKPMGHLSIGALLFQILSLLEIIDANALQTSAIGPVMLALLGNFHFFKTGHQATLSSIQWEAAFIPFRTLVYPWAPLLVMGNTFGAQIVTAAAVPLTVLWKRDPKQKGVLSDVFRAVATYMLVHATINLATTVWAGHLRRHLMLYRIFSPRWMMGSMVLLVTDVVAVWVGLGGVRVSVGSVAEVFGWAYA